MTELVREAIWSSRVSEADWVVEAIGHPEPSPDDFVVGGFEAYAQILHPAEEVSSGQKTVRWSEVAAWSGLPLEPQAGFESIALPQSPPMSPRPWSGQGPDIGRLYRPYVEVLAEILRGWTDTPDSCWFCLWDGYGHIYGSRGGSMVALRSGEKTALDEIPPTVPREALDGPRVQLPYLSRDYLLFCGPVEAAYRKPFNGEWSQSPNMWWPTDRAWFVATEIDYPWTYVGGSAGMIEQIVSDDRIEAIRTPVPGQFRPVGWIHDLAVSAVEQLLESGHVVIETSAGTVEAWLGRGELRTKSASKGGFKSTSLTYQVEPDHLRHRMESTIIQLVGPS